MTNNKKFLLLTYIFVLAHTIKDFFQDFLEWDVLTFADANENLWALPKAGRWTLALANESAVWIGIALVIFTPLVFKHRRPILEKLLVAGYLFFLITLASLMPGIIHFIKAKRAKREVGEIEEKI